MKRSRLFCLLLALALCLSLAAPALAAQDAALTRGEFVAGLFGVSGDPDASPRQDAFDDVPAEGALAQAVGWAYASGVVNGYGRGRFGPDDPVTREQMVTMLYRCALALGQAPAGEWMFPLGFADAGAVSAWADKAMQWAVMNRIIIGTGSGLAPRSTATDEQLSIVLDRWEDFLVPEGASRGAIILFTSDVHCGVGEGFGYAGLQEIRNALRAQGYDVLLVDDGDSIQGGPLGTVTKGEALAGLMNRTGYDVAIPGNHEFDYGVGRFLSLAEQAEFPYISCNFNYKGERLFEPYKMFELAGKKIAFVGVTTPETLTSSTPGYFKDADGEFVYGFLQDETGEGVYAAVQSAVDAARAEGAEHVIVMGHLGYYAESAPWNYADVITHTTGVDVLLDGHSHDTEQAVVKNAAGKDVLRAACGTKLACVGWCRITPEGSFRTGLYTWDGSVPAAEKLGIDNEMSRAVAQAEETLKAAFDQVVARTSVALTINDPVAVDTNGRPIRMIRRAETNLGDFCADAYRDQSGADIAFVNGGGIRDSIPAGDITLRAVFNVHPYGNSLCMIEVTGQQLLDALEWGARSIPGENGGFLQVSGLSYEIDSGVPTPCVADVNGMFALVSGERRVKNVRVGDAPIDPEKTYTLAGHDYMLLNNGDGYTMFDGAPLLLNCVKLDNQVLIDYITETLGGEIGAEYADPFGQGRITVR